MNIIQTESIGCVSLHIDQQAKNFEGKLDNIPGVSKVFYGLLDKYEIQIYVGKAFDAEQVILNCKAELIKHSE